MVVKSYYEAGSCEEYYKLKGLFNENNRNKVLKEGICQLLPLIKEGNTPDILQKNIYNYLSSHYQQTWFSFPWQLSQAVNADVAKVMRFLGWLGNISIKELSRNISYVTCKKLLDGSNTLSQYVDIIAHDTNGCPMAIIISVGKNNRSVKGQSVHTASGTDLRAMLSKYVLEKEYPNITVYQVYLSHLNDTSDKLAPFEITGRKSSNVIINGFSSYYDGTEFDFDAFNGAILDVLDSPLQASCYDCDYAAYCHIPKVQEFTEPAENVEEGAEPESTSGYVMPNFTSAQSQVVSHVDGPMRVCAGPGSGKTATLIGRIKKLIDDGVAPEFILAFTFTNEAASVLEQRCLSFCEENSMPRVCTINSFCYQTILDNKDLCEEVLGYASLKLLTISKRYEIIESLISLYPKLEGVSYEKKLGRNGYCKTLSDRLDNFFVLGRDEFFKKYPMMGERFEKFALEYREIVDASGYIGFDQQISICNELFSKCPEALEVYQKVYKYVMVDEYQDVNAEQVSVIYALAAKHHNLVVVGDDDQSIYGFRGASSSYMMDFVKKYPEAKTVVLSENFRTASALVDAAQKLIQNNKKRLEKDVHATRDIHDSLPIVVNASDAAAVSAVVTKCVSDGYSYGDIAVLSTKNAPLESLAQEVSFPHVLAKCYLRQDPWFLFLYAALSLYYDIKNDKAWYLLLSVFGQMAPFAECKGGFFDAVTGGQRSVIVDSHRSAEDGITNMLSYLRDAFDIFMEGLDVPLTLQMFSYKFNLEHLSAMTVLSDTFEKNHVLNIEGMAAYMEQMIQYEDETRVEVESGDRVTFITSHDSKGKEFGVVIMLNDYAEDSNSNEEVRRLFYVAMTRPKDRLYILSPKETGLLKEIPHTTWDVAG